jgi:hypothetical protein
MIIDVFHAVYIFSLMLSWILPFRNIWEAAAANFYKTYTKSHQRGTLCHRSAPALSATNCMQFEHEPRNIP